MVGVSARIGISKCGETPWAWLTPCRSRRQPCVLLLSSLYPWPVQLLGLFSLTEYPELSLAHLGLRVSYKKTSPLGYKWPCLARAWWADAVCDLGTGFSSIFRVEQGLDSSLPPLTRWARHPFAGHCLRNLPRGPAKDTGFIFQIWHLGDWYFAWAIRLWLVLSLLSYLNPGFEVWGSMLDRFACNMVIYFIEDRVFFSEF